MSAYKSDFLQVLAERGFIHQVSDAAGLDAKAAAGPITAYVGFDATAPKKRAASRPSLRRRRCTAYFFFGFDFARGRKPYERRIF